MGQIEHSATVTCIEDSLEIANGYTITAEQERVTYEEGTANREIVDENILEFL